MGKRLKRRDWSTVGFIAPSFILFTVFIMIPVAASFYYSLTSWDGISPNVPFVGLRNYIEIFTSARFGNALFNTVLLTVFVSIFENLIALGLALLVDQVRWGKNFFRSGLYIPVLISGIVSGFIWKIIFNYNFGPLNAGLNAIGLDALCQDWLGGKGTFALWAVGIVLIWKGAGYYMIIYLASLQSVSKDILEAATVDGASPGQRLWKITLPLISGAFTINFTLSLINGLKIFDQISVMTDGGPGFSTETVVYLLYKVGVSNGRQGFGTAVGVVLLVIIMILNSVQQKFLKSREVQM